ncbi:hypothetical protein QCA50_015570 [Cerrena zonata]|uniref:Uncharacterized protein n=1 Tax=Cerrena zonata TaxID=2478898 RepID=A0AAW0FK51_9APHY
MTIHHRYLLAPCTSRLKISIPLLQQPFIKNQDLPFALDGHPNTPTTYGPITRRTGRSLRSVNIYLATLFVDSGGTGVQTSQAQHVYIPESEFRSHSDSIGRQSALRMRKLFAAVSTSMLKAVAPFLVLTSKSHLGFPTYGVLGFMLEVVTIQACR